MTLQEKSLVAANIFTQTKMRLSEKAASLTCGQAPAGWRMRICRFALKILQTPSLPHLQCGNASTRFPRRRFTSGQCRWPLLKPFNHHFGQAILPRKPSKSHLCLYDHLYAIPALAGPVRCITSVRLNPTSLHHLSKSAPV